MFTFLDKPKYTTQQKCTSSVCDCYRQLEFLPIPAELAEIRTVGSPASAIKLDYWLNSDCILSDAVIVLQYHSIQALHPP